MMRPIFSGSCVFLVALASCGGEGNDSAAGLKSAVASSGNAGSGGSAQQSSSAGSSTTSTSGAATSSTAGSAAAGNATSAGGATGGVTSSTPAGGGAGNMSSVGTPSAGAAGAATDDAAGSTAGSTTVTATAGSSSMADEGDDDALDADDDTGAFGDDDGDDDFGFGDDDGDDDFGFGDDDAADDADDDLALGDDDADDDDMGVGGAGAGDDDDTGGDMMVVSGEVSPSSGCSGGGEGTPSNSLVSKPSGYDGSTPLPLVIAMHAAGNGNDQLRGIFGGEGTDRDYLMVFPKSSGNGWTTGDTGRIDEAYDSMLSGYCVDTNRVFAIGHSSGAQMLTQLLCAGEDRFRAVSPVASSKYCDGWDSVPAVVIHGLTDDERGPKYGINDGDGQIDFGVYRDSNGCGMEEEAFTPGGSCGGNVDPGCVEMQGCDAPTLWCNHNDPQYGTSNHGVPCFGPDVVFDFFDRFQ